MSRTVINVGNKLIVISLILGLAISMVTWFLISASRQNKTDFEVEINNVGKNVQQQFDAVVVRVKDLAGFVSAGMEADVDTKLRQASRVSNNLIELGYFYSDDPSKSRVYYAKNTTLDFNTADFGQILGRLNAQPGLVISFAAGGKGAFKSIDPNHLVLMQSLYAKDPLGLKTNRSRFLITYAVVDLDGILYDTTFDLRNSRFLESRFLVEGQARRVRAQGAPVDQDWNGDRRQISLVVTRNLSLTLEFVRTLASSVHVVVFSFGILILASIAAGLFFLSESRHRDARLQLKLAADAERQANSAKSDFLATMSHEIRTPLNGVLGMAELLTRSELTPTQRRYAEQIRQSGSMLLGILNDVLDMSKLESGKLAVDLVRMDLHAVMQETVRFFVPNAQEKGLNLLLDIEPDVPRAIEMDPMRFRQILSNLVSNAIKFTDRGEILVSAMFKPGSGADGELTVAVTDQGIGMTADERARLFTRFNQANTGTTRKYGGTGLGLAICKQLCETLGGSIDVQSEINRGSRFTFRLPIEISKTAEVTARLSCSVALVCDSPIVSDIVRKTFRTKGIDLVVFPYTDDLASRLVLGDAYGTPFGLVIFNEERDIHAAKDLWQSIATKIIPSAKSIILGHQEANRSYLAFDGAVPKPFLPSQLLDLAAELLEERRSLPVEPAVEQAEKKEARLLFQDRRLLLVDDNHVNLLIAEEYLSRYGFAISTATNGIKAVKAAEDGDFDIIFMDCQMPEMDGYEATGIIRRKMADGTIRRAPILALTANALKGDRERCLEAGMDDFLSKPLQDAALMGVFDRLIEMPEFEWLGLPIQDAGKPRANAAPQMVELASPGRARPEAGAAQVVKASTAAQGSVDRNSLQSGDQTMPSTPHQPPAGAPEASPVIRKQAPATTSTPVAMPSPAAQAGGVPSPRPVDAAAVASREAEAKSAATARVPLMDVAEFERTRSAMKKFDLLLSLYRNDTSEYLKVIRLELGMNNLQEAILPAHTIKSASRMIGASGLSALAENMEKRLRLGQGTSPAELQALSDKMDKVFEATLAAIDRLMEKQIQAAAE
ncbi:hybrid sensor histidine kinase/response regulator [Peteryoungia ipomoeae]|uniref:histidine kinase n=1 Tax=Peteryoungia ipomoeae TaxID=1210932 RepID=A0A4S8NZC2_9HYPH|nr:hybrid sensor histidine kinase/response regulator [Peteryoungia ipomoeae]THV20584.1 response regulator [Peteryoungia ipomoeae]